MKTSAALANIVASVFVIAITCSPLATAADEGQNRAKKTQTKPTANRNAKPKKVNPAFQPPAAVAGLPNVLLIGDSISIGYMVDARKQLEGVANVYRPAVNCGPTTRGLESLESWIGDRKWDVIHFNFGLHDLKFMGPKGQNLADPNAATSHRQVPIDQYEANLRKIAKRLKATGATVIWRETTPVPEGAAGRIPEDAKRYNDAAAKVMAEVGGIQTDPMYDFALEHADLQRPANVHYTAAGSKKLAEQVTKSVRAALEKK
ncbi:secreted protein containing Lipase, GDSL domain protein [Rhodopirellula maiorica SM1]|uniref:Secreted protein containing Lipase, GDSL domain protein n=1 Tax=Rhodopirellula maiorica SM1 TaxID=1265738 RepID=M5RRY1_9BACT|nr:SGNH/GDSL hydrolase family protein [Rhodopirellula maiorica]EMI22103.1 secreted protein containing Lipase, GDSL domain protein [Rhodopirellula maiorica SM1]